MLHRHIIQQSQQTLGQIDNPVINATRYHHQPFSTASSLLYKSFFSSLTKVIMQWAINKMNSIVEYPSSDSFGLPKITEWDLRLPDESFGPTKWPGEE